MTEMNNATVVELHGEEKGTFRHPDTGVLTVYAPADEYVVRNIRQIEAYKEHLRREAYRERSRGRNFVVCPDEPVKELSQKLELNELGALIKLLPYLQLNRDGLLVKDGKNMTIGDIEKVIGKKRRMTSTILNSLADAGVVIKDGSNRTPRYSISRDYHWMGTVGKGVYFTKFYQVESRARMENLSIHEAGLLYKLLPYFHPDTCLLCSNPNERDVEMLNPLSHEQLASLIGEDPRVVRTHMNSLINHFFVKKSMSGGGVTYEVNPDVMFRGSETGHTQVVRSQFRALEKASKLA